MLWISPSNKSLHSVIRNRSVTGHLSSLGGRCSASMTELLPYRGGQAACMTAAILPPPHRPGLYPGLMPQSPFFITLVVRNKICEVYK